MQITIEVSALDLADSIRVDESMAVVKAVDSRMADYEWTLELARYLVGELIKCCEEDGETFDLSSILPDKWGK